jgi:2-polyprenyl-3-methyl-5-hydroxy-6-metoxy-1,4-benzoquinol methylase
MNDVSLGMIFRAYEGCGVRLYNRLRFLTLRRRMLDEIGQYLPRSGQVLDIGCGFGLFSLYFAAQRPELRIRGIDLSPRRIALAQQAAARLGLGNVQYEVGDAGEFRSSGGIQGAYMIDLVHHLPREAVPRLLTPIAESLEPGARLVIKDIEPSPMHKLAYTWLLDKFMDRRAPLNYWTPGQVRDVLQRLGLSVYKHSMLDLLPCPHVMYIAVKEAVAPRGC